VTLYLKPPSEELIEYARDLYLRRGEAVLVPPGEASIGDWVPQANECHSNVSTFVLNTSGFAAVRGWLYFDFVNAFPFVRFLAHSVVRNGEGSLYDITPLNAAQPYILGSESV
jgi:hypothetical protein